MSPDHRRSGRCSTPFRRRRRARSAFCTNFFPVRAKLQGWIDHGELFGEFRDRRGVFFSDRTVISGIFIFAPRDLAALQARDRCNVRRLKTERVVTDLVGNESALAGLLRVLEKAGFRRYTAASAHGANGPGLASKICQPKIRRSLSRKSRMSRRFWSCSKVRSIVMANNFRCFTKLKRRSTSRQILAVKSDGVLAGLLFFETQGFASTVRFWAVAEKFRARECRFGLDAALSSQRKLPSGGSRFG